jgi:hypothetical protein
MNNERRTRIAFEQSDKDGAPEFPANDRKGRDTRKGRFRPADSANL